MLPHVDDVTERVVLVVDIFPKRQVEQLLLRGSGILPVEQSADGVDPVVGLDLDEDVVGVNRTL